MKVIASVLLFLHVRESKQMYGSFKTSPDAIREQINFDECNITPSGTWKFKVHQFDNNKALDSTKYFSKPLCNPLKTYFECLKKFAENTTMLIEDIIYYYYIGLYYLNKIAFSYMLRLRLYYKIELDMHKWTC